jgi:hypothetical protein
MLVNKLVQYNTTFAFTSITSGKRYPHDQNPAAKDLRGISIYSGRQDLLPIRGSVPVLGAIRDALLGKPFVPSYQSLG